MWIVLRLILAAIGFCIRQWRRRSTPEVHAGYEGMPYYLDLAKNKSKITGFKIGMARASPTWIRFHAESTLDRVFKRVGMANETQTGDDAFDRTVYVTCDHPFVATLLRHTPALRGAIVAAIAQGYRRISFDGTTVWLERASSTPPDGRDLALLAAVHAASGRLEEELPSRFSDPFLWKALVVEGAIWGIVGYAIGAVIEMAAHKEDYHLQPGDVVVTGLGVAVVAFLVLLAIIALWMRGSSRGHRIIIESAFVLLIGLPTTCIQVVGDTNRSMDDAPDRIATATVEQCEARLHRGRRGRTYYTYHLWLERTAGVPREIEVTHDLCNAASSGDTAALSIGPGRWGLPWYRSISVGGETWTAP